VARACLGPPVLNFPLVLPVRFEGESLNQADRRAVDDLKGKSDQEVGGILVENLLFNLAKRRPGLLGPQAGLHWPWPSRSALEVELPPFTLPRLPDLFSDALTHRLLRSWPKVVPGAVHETRSQPTLREGLYESNRGRYLEWYLAGRNDVDRPQN